MVGPGGKPYNGPMLPGRSRSAGRLVLCLLVFPLLVGCAARYFRDVEAPSQPALRHTLQAWPYREYWTGVVFNGEKIGLTHLALQPAGGDQYELRAEALLAFHFLGFDKRVTLASQDWVTDDLRLNRFVHDYDLDGNRLRLTGRVEQGQLVVERESGGRMTSETIPLTGPIYPSSAIALYPTWQGLAVGREYRYQVYDGQRQQLAAVSQAIEAYQESDLFSGRAYRVATKLDGQEATTWVNERGEPVLEMAWHGILISSLESEAEAKAYLAQASLNKRDVLVEFSLIRTSRPIPAPRAVRRLLVNLAGLPDAFTIPSDQWQDCRREGPNARCFIQAVEPAAIGEPRPVPLDELKPYLKPTQTIDSQDREIQRTAREIVGPATEPLAQVRRVVAWLQEQVAQEPADVFTSREVFDKRKAECQGLTWLYAAFARSLDVPTKVVNGLVYVGELGGFLYHTWAESYVGGRWLPIDPTFGQVGADATHIKLIEGDRPADLLPLVDLVGRIRIEALSDSRS
ncbi:MAG: transglutaminase-like domain-containing protein [Nitrospirota bacterium]